MEEQKFTLVLTNQQLDVVYKGLLELPSKHSLPVIQELERQLRPVEETKKEEVVKEKIIVKKNK